VTLRKPSDLFNKKETSGVFNSPEVSTEITESYDRFRDNFDKVNNLSEKVEQLSQQLSEKLNKTDLENAMLSQLMVLDENFKSLQNQVKGLNKEDLKEFKTTVSNLTEIVEELVEDELPKFKKQFTKNQINIGEKFDELKEVVEENISSIKEDVDTTVHNIAEVIDNNLEYFNNQLQETQSKVKATSETYNKLSKSLEKKVAEENEKLEEYSQVIQGLYEAFVELETSLQEETSTHLQVIEEKFETISLDVSDRIDNINEKVGIIKDKVSSEISNIKADVVINEQHLKKFGENIQEYDTRLEDVDKYLQENHKELVALREEVFIEIEQIPVGNLQENLERLEKKIDYIKETYSRIEPEVVVQEVIKEGLLNEPPNTKNSDSLTPLDQNFVTLDQLQNHYRLFINRIQQQLSTLGGGGETRFKYLDDIVGLATNSSAYDGKVLSWNSTINKAEFVSVGDLDSDTLDTVTDRGNTTTNEISVAAVNIPVGSVISGISSIVANIGNENLNVVLEHGDSANLGIGSYGLTYGITGIPYAVYELQSVPTPTLQIDDVIAGAAIPVGSKIIGIGTGAYNKVIITDINFPVGAPLPITDEVITFARETVNAGMSILTGNDVDITLNAGPGGNIVNHSDILPYTTNEWSLGSPAKRFKQIWFGTGTIYVQDETLGNDQALGAKDGNFYIQGGAGLEVGEWILRDNTLQIKDSTRDVYIGQLGATADIIFNRSVRIEDSSNRTHFYSDRTGRTQFYPPTIPAGDIGGVSIIGSTNGAYQPIVNSGGMLHITGNDGAVSRITNDAWGTGAFPAYISRAGRGTAASPSASQSGDILSRYSSVGWGSTGFAGGLAANNIEVVARENFTNTAQSAEYRFYNAPIGSTTKTLDLTINTEGLSFVGTGSTTGITFYDNSRLTYFPPQTAGTADKFLKVTNVAGNYVMSWETPPTIEGAVIYKGLYTLATNTPPITDATGEAGWQYTVVGFGTTNFGLNGDLYLQDGDLLIHNGTHYDLIPGLRTQLNSDWNATTGVTAILNKPTIVNKIIGGTGVSVSPVNGIGTVTINATGTQDLNSVLTNGNTSALGINVGVVSATSYTGNGVNLTGIVTSIVAGTGGISVSGSTGRVTINATAQVNSDWNSNVGVASILNKPKIVNEIYAGAGITISYSNGFGSGITTVTTTYAPVAGIATYAVTAGYSTSAGIATYATISGYSTSAGIATYATSAGIATYAVIAGYSTSSGISSTSQGLTGTPNITVGIVTASNLIVSGGASFAGVVTATSFSGSGTNLTGIVTSIVAGTGITVSNSTGQVTINATGAGIGQTGYYGSFYDTTQQANVGISTWNFVSIGNTYSSNGVSIASTNRITFAYGGVYAINYDLHFKNTNTSIQNIDVWFRKNGVDIPNSNSGYNIVAKGTGPDGLLLASLQYIVTVNANDYIQILWNGNHAGIALTTTAAQSSPTIPVSPSAIIGVTQASNVLANTQDLNTTLGYGNTSSRGMSVGVVTTTKLVCTDGGTFSGVVTATSYSGSGTNLTGIVTSLIAGSNISLSGSTGQVTINATGAGGRTLVYKTADQSITSDSTLNNDSELFFTMAANTKYQFKLEVFFDSGTTPDFKWRHSGPTSPTLVRIVERGSAPGSTTLSFNVATAYSSSDNALTSSSATTGGYVSLEGIIHNGVNAGDFHFQWSQNSSSTTATTVRAGSYIEYGVVA
jgi:hypothetical protein